MRPLVFVLGLAFVATVLIANVNALNCYFGRKGEKVPSPCPNGEDQCLSYDNGNKGCGSDRDCNDYDSNNGQRPKKGVQCCYGDYCNDDTSGAGTSAPPVPLLIAVIASAITVLGI